MSDIEIKLSTLFHLQIDDQTGQINQELEQYLQQYLQFFVDYREKNQIEWLVMAEFAVNDKIYLANKMSLFIVSYERESRMGADIRRKEKVEKVIEFTERMKKIQ